MAGSEACLLLASDNMLLGGPARSSPSPKKSFGKHRLRFSTDSLLRRFRVKLPWRHEAPHQVSIQRSSPGAEENSQVALISSSDMSSCQPAATPASPSTPFHTPGTPPPDTDEPTNNHLSKFSHRKDNRAVMDLSERTSLRWSLKKLLPLEPFQLQSVLHPTLTPECLSSFIPVQTLKEQDSRTRISGFQEEEGPLHDYITMEEELFGKDVM
ncbi:unnamed protein product [Pleuronectes platessa]|uniref:Uncharacterized protein n=1 Tax=Pleuronectes platessa TaxID=8262 RepID=A0A9N7UPA2_PLEPL|nr:unnamed protein product [Pleuronectes platessa]